MWEACPLSFSLQLSDLHSSCTHTQAHTRGFHDACAPYATILSDHDKVLVSLSPSSPCTTLDSFHIHTDNTARTLPPSFLIFSTYFVLPTSAHHHFILCITIGHTLPQSAFWVNEYQTALPASWEIYVQVKKPQLKLDMEKKKKTGHGTTDWFQIRKEVHQGCILSPCLFNLYAEYIMWNARLDEAQAGIQIAGRNMNNLRYADDTTLMAESEELKSLLMKMKEESEKSGLKLNIQETKIMASGPITSWQMGKQWKQWETLFWGSPKSLQMVTAVMKLKDTCSLEEKLWPTQLSSVQWLSRVRLFVAPCTAAHQASLSITNPQSLLKLMSIESVMPSNHLILCCPLLLPPSIFPSVRVFSNSQFFSSGDQSIGASATASVLPMNTQDWPPSGWTG